MVILLLDNDHVMFSMVMITWINELDDNNGDRVHDLCTICISNVMKENRIIINE